jgi:hypothetical protein
MVMDSKGMVRIWKGMKPVKYESASQTLTVTIIYDAKGRRLSEGPYRGGKQAKLREGNATWLMFWKRSWGVASVERLDGPSEEVEVDNEGDSVGGGSEAACCHERPVEAVGAGEETLEGDGGGRRVRIIICVVEGRGAVVVRRGGGSVGSVGEVSGVGGGGLGGLGGLRDGSEGLHVGRGPPEEAPRHHGRPELGLLW